jgi:mono/diheme cytochrome c family protein
MNARALFVALLLTAAPALAEEQPVELKPGPNLDVVQANCGSCHSLDYIPMNSPFLESAAWKAEIAKMRSAFGAPIDDKDADAILKYLSATYGAPGS